MPKNEKYEDFLIGSDIHGCYLDRRAWRAFLGVAASKEWHQCILNGDVCDFSQLSSHDRKIGRLDREYEDPYTLDEEIFCVQTEILGPLRKALGKKTKIVMRLGNHEMRWMQVSESNPTALAQMLRTMRKNRSMDLEDVLALRRYGVELSYKPVDVLYNHFTLIHGVKTNKMVAKQNLLRYGSGTSGHTHRVGTWTEVMHGKLQAWYESGCLRTIDNVEYLPFGDRPDWCNAFLELKINADRFFCLPHKIIKGETCFHGQIFQG